MERVDAVESKTASERLFLDTNTVIALLRGHVPLSERMTQSRWKGISLITSLEFLADRELSESTKEEFARLLPGFHVIDLRREDTRLLDTVVEIRRRFGLKLPDAIIAASAKVSDATLLTQDTGFQRLTREGFLNVETF